MIKTKFTGVYYRETQRGDKVFYIKGKIKGKSYLEKVGSYSEGVRAAYANQVRNKKHSLSRMGEDSPMYERKKLTLDEGAENYFSSREGKSDNRNNRSRYRNHLKPVFGNTYMEEITASDIEKLMSEKRKEVSFKTGRHYSEKSINDWINLLSVIYNHNEVSPNPTKKVIRVKDDDARERYLTEEEIAVLFESIEKHKKLRKKDQITLFVALALTTGARATSVLSITMADILNDKIRIKDHKNNSTYYAALHPSVQQLIPEGLVATDYLVGASSRQLHRTSIYKMIQPVLDELFNKGIPVGNSKRRVVVHTFRHTFGSLLAIKGTPIYTIKKLMNHSDIKMTMRYAKLAPDSGFEAVRSLNI